VYISKLSNPPTTSCVDTVKEPRCKTGCCQRRDVNSLLVQESDNVFFIECEELLGTEMIFSSSCLPSGIVVPQNDVIFNINKKGTTNIVNGATISSVVKTITDQDTDDLSTISGTIRVSHDVGMYYFTISAPNYDSFTGIYEVSQDSVRTHDIDLNFNPTSQATITTKKKTDIMRQL